MNLTSMLVVINDQTEDISNIPENIKYAGSRVQLLVYNNHCENQILLEKLKKIATIWVDNNSPFIKTFSECVNELLRLCQADFVCVSREDALYSENWLKKLIETYNLIESSGVISINDLSTNEGNYQLTKYNTLEWVYSNEFRINNFAFFKTDLIYKIGGFNPEINGVFAFWDICDRARLKGYYNYFVPDTNLIRQELYFDHFTEPSVNVFNSRKIIEFVKIFNFSQEDEKNINSLSSKFGSLFYWNDKLGCLVFGKQNELPLQMIESLAKEMNILKLKMDLYCSSYFENDILKMSFIGLIRPF
jgi:hypothetical protein